MSNPEQTMDLRHAHVPTSLVCALMRLDSVIILGRQSSPTRALGHDSVPSCHSIRGTSDPSFSRVRQRVSTAVIIIPFPPPATHCSVCTL